MQAKEADEPCAEVKRKQHVYNFPWSCIYNLDARPPGGLRAFGDRMNRLSHLFVASSYIHIMLLYHLKELGAYLFFYGMYFIPSTSLHPPPPPITLTLPVRHNSSFSGNGDSDSESCPSNNSPDDSDNILSGSSA